ncbi:MAG: twin-arginine translocase TatA/TatE family subunit [Desulfovibrionaceae bacterium]|nr:twin-arginine translocase TatA/TatE family subunit [Desulfovibrionaceae bacterium]
MFGIGATELIIILVIVLVIYGGKRLPELGSSFGKAIRNFRGAGSEPEEIEVPPRQSPVTPRKDAPAAEPSAKKDADHP